MKDIEKSFYQADFSRYSDLKSRLARQLFPGKSSDRTVSFPFSRISDEEAEFVNAARGFMPDALTGKNRQP